MEQGEQGGREEGHKPDRLRIKGGSKSLMGNAFKDNVNIRKDIK